MKINKYLALSACLIYGLFVFPSYSHAHVTVKPGEVGVGERMNFIVSVPTEEDTPTTSVRLVIPEEMQSVRPNVKPGWEVELVKVSEGETQRVSEIIWSGGAIPAEQRDEFVFSAQAPASETTLNWKAYQTYGDGTVVAWDQDPKVVEEYTKKNPPIDGQHDHDAPKPFSITTVINDLEEANSTSQTKSTSSSNTSVLLSSGAFLFALGAFIMQLRKK